MTTHILVKHSDTSFVCGEERQESSWWWIGDLEERCHDEGMCQRCLDMEPLAQLADTDLGDEGSQGPLCVFCHVPTSKKIDTIPVCTPCFASRQ